MGNAHIGVRSHSFIQVQQIQCPVSSYRITRKACDYADFQLEECEGEGNVHDATAYSRWVENHTVVGSKLMFYCQLLFLWHALKKAYCAAAIQERPHSCCMLQKVPPGKRSESSSSFHARVVVMGLGATR